MAPPREMDASEKTKPGCAGHGGLRGGVTEGVGGPGAGCGPGAARRAPRKEGRAFCGDALGQVPAWGLGNELLTWSALEPGTSPATQTRPQATPGLPHVQPVHASREWPLQSRPSPSPFCNGDTEAQVVTQFVVTALRWVGVSRGPSVIRGPF